MTATYETVDGLDVLGPMFMETNDGLGKWVTYPRSDLGKVKCERYSFSGSQKFKLR